MSGNIILNILLSPIGILSALGLIAVIAVAVMQGKTGEANGAEGELTGGAPHESAKALSSVIGIVVAVLILVAIGMVLVPIQSTPRPVSQQNACINQLRQIDSAKEQWAMAQSKMDGDPVVTSEVNGYIKGNTTPSCPAGGTYRYRAIGTPPTCTMMSPSSHVLVW